MVIWVTGLSGTGKTTLCAALRERLKPALPQVVVLDGDAIRAAFGADLGFGIADRIAQIQRIQRLAKYLSEEGLIVLVAALYSNAELLAWNRENLDPYFEIFLDAPLSFLCARDAKGLYAAARTGAISDVVGLDIPHEPPARPDLAIDAAHAPAPAKLAERVIAAVPDLAPALSAAA